MIFLHNQLIVKSVISNSTVLFIIASHFGKWLTFWNLVIYKKNGHLQQPILYYMNFKVEYVVEPVSGSIGHLIVNNTPPVSPVGHEVT